MSRTILLAAFSPAQQTVAIRGVVHDDTGNLVPGAGVNLVLRDELIAESQTDSVGTFHFDGLAPAGYQLHVAKRAFASAGSPPKIWLPSPSKSYSKLRRTSKTPFPSSFASPP